MDEFFATEQCEKLAAVILSFLFYFIFALGSFEKKFANFFVSHLFAFEQFLLFY